MIHARIQQYHADGLVDQKTLTNTHAGNTKPKSLYKIPSAMKNYLKVFKVLILYRRLGFWSISHNGH